MINPEILAAILAIYEKMPENSDEEKLLHIPLLEKFSIFRNEPKKVILKLEDNKKRTIYIGSNT